MIEKFENYKVVENHIGFMRKLKEMSIDKAVLDEIIKLIPKEIILPLYYPTDKVENVEGKIIKINSVYFKKNEYTYYYNDPELDNEEVYCYEDEIVSLAK